MDKKIFIPLLIILFLSLASAASKTQTPSKVGETFNITQTCSINNATGGFCESCTLTSIDNPGTIGGYFLVHGIYSMDSVGGGNFVYETSMNQSGDYTIHGYCSVGSLTKTFDFTKVITPSGDIRGSAMVVFLFAATLLIFTFGWFQHNIWAVYISGILAMLTGVYVMINGFINLNDTYTQAVAMTSIGFGIIFFVIGAYEQLGSDGE